MSPNALSTLISRCGGASAALVKVANNYPDWPPEIRAALYAEADEQHQAWIAAYNAWYAATFPGLSPPFSDPAQIAGVPK